MSELQEAIARLKRTIGGEGGIHWQSVAVLWMNAPEHRDKITEYITGSYGRRVGWFRDGHGNGGYATSLYLSPKGMPYFCGHTNHYQLYGEIMGRISGHKLDRAGWLHISDARVDIHAIPTAAQTDWLAANKPKGQHDWDMRPYDGGATRQPVPYDKAEPFDVRPIKDDDWDRLERRIYNAANKVDPATLPERMNFPCPAPERRTDWQTAYSFKYIPDIGLLINSVA